jgi:hypothetical protein
VLTTRAYQLEHFFFAAMKTMATMIIAAAAAAALVAAECPSGCSGHGECQSNDNCECWPNYMGMDCSQRVCAYGRAWSDQAAGDLNHDGGVSDVNVATQLRAGTINEAWPSAAGEGHAYVECSNAGYCDRVSGECKCFPNFTGSACQRMKCPADCSGHGRCRTVREIAAGALNGRRTESVAGLHKFEGVTTPFAYNRWDADMSQSCVCDAGWFGHDCSERVCPRGDDPLTIGQRYCGDSPCHWTIQSFHLLSAGEHLLSINWENWQGYNQNVTMVLNTQDDAPGYLSLADSADQLPDADSVAYALMTTLRNEFPEDQLGSVEVRCAAKVSGSVGAYTYDYTQCTPGGRNLYMITFVSVPGKQNLLSMSGLSAPTDEVPAYAYADPEAEDASAGSSYMAYGNLEELSCSGRGACDTSSGVCACYAGYYGAACENQNALVF